MEKYFAQRGTIRHDLAELAQLDWLSEKMGGETLLKKKYPELYKILLHTRERQPTVLQNFLWISVHSVPRNASIYKENHRDHKAISPAPFNYKIIIFGCDNAYSSNLSLMCR